MDTNQNTIINIITCDDVTFSIRFFSHELGLFKFLVPILSSFIDDDIEDLNWQDIIDKYDDDDLDKMKIIEPIVLPGIHSRVFKYLLEFTNELQNFKNTNPKGNLCRFSYNRLRNHFDIKSLLDFYAVKKKKILIITIVYFHFTN